jgi:hypothetical protein
MADVKDIRGRYTPVQIAAKVSWEKAKNAILIYEDENGDVCLNISEMDFKTRLWLTAELTNYNAATGVISLLERIED